MRSLPLLPALLLAVPLVLAPRGADAATLPPQIESQLSQTEVGLDEPFKVVVTISRDATQQYQSYVRPDSKDLEVISQSQFEQTQWTIVSGAQSVRSIEQHVYVMKARRKGTITIPPAVIRIDGREVKSRELVITVNPAAATPRRPGSTGAGQPSNPLDPFAAFGMAPTPSPEGMSGGEDVFVEARVETARPRAAATPPPTIGAANGAGPPPGAPGAPASPPPPAPAPPSGPVTAHVGEQLIVTWTLYTRAEIWRFSNVSEPKHEDFWSEELYAPKRLSWQLQTINGRQYQAYVLNKTALFPLRAGRLTVSPRVVEVTTAETAFYPGASAQRSSKPVSIEVLPLPAAGRPEGFEASNVGRFEVTSAVDNPHPKAGEAITLRVTVKGRGNLRNVKVPRLDRVEGFKVYEPTAVDSVEKKEAGVEGTRVLTYLLLPRKGGPLTVPAIELPYFDPGEDRYATSVAPAINITVEGDPDKVGSGGGPEAKENLLAPRIKPLRRKRHLDFALGERILRGPAMLVALGAPPALLLLIVAGGTLRARLRRETAGSRRRRARAAARRHLKACEQHIKGGRGSAFHGECARAIYEHLEFRLGMRFESYTLEDLGRLLVERGLEPELARAIAAELQAGDFARFSTANSGPGEMRAALGRVEKLLDEIERARVGGGAPGAEEVV